MCLGLDASLSHQGRCLQTGWYIFQVDITAATLNYQIT